MSQNCDPGPVGPARYHGEGPRRAARGFTTTELLIALFVAGILAGLAAPSMTSFVKNNRIKSHTLDLMNMINYARSEGLKRRSRVVLCRSADPTATNPTCGGTNNVWTTGWLVFEEQSSPPNNTYESGTDHILKIGLAATEDVTVMTNGTSNRNLEFNLDGTTNENGGTAMFAVCDARGGEHGRLVSVAPHGRSRLTKGAAGAAIDCTP